MRRKFYWYCKFNPHPDALEAFEVEKRKQAKAKIINPTDKIDKRGEYPVNYPTFKRFYKDDGHSMYYDPTPYEDVWFEHPLAQDAYGEEWDDEASSKDEFPIIQKIAKKIWIQITAERLYMYPFFLPLFLFLMISFGLKEMWTNCYPPARLETTYKRFRIDSQCYITEPIFAHQFFLHKYPGYLNFLPGEYITLFAPNYRSKEYAWLKAQKNAPFHPFVDLVSTSRTLDYDFTKVKARHYIYKWRGHFLRKQILSTWTGSGYYTWNDKRGSPYELKERRSSRPSAHINYDRLAERKIRMGKIRSIQHKKAFHLRDIIDFLGSQQYIMINGRETIKEYNKVLGFMKPNLLKPTPINLPYCFFSSSLFEHKFLKNSYEQHIHRTSVRWIRLHHHKSWYIKKEFEPVHNRYKMFFRKTYEPIDMKFNQFYPSGHFDYNYAPVRFYQNKWQNYANAQPFIEDFLYYELNKLNPALAELPYYKHFKINQDKVFMLERMMVNGKTIKNKTKALINHIKKVQATFPFIPEIKNISISPKNSISGEHMVVKDYLRTQNNIFKDSKQLPGTVLINLIKEPFNTGISDEAEIFKNIVTSDIIYGLLRKDYFNMRCSNFSDLNLSRNYYKRLLLLSESEEEDV